MLTKSAQWWKTKSAAAHRVCIMLYLLMPSLGPIAAAPIAAPALAATLTQTFKAEGDVAKGNIVSLDSSTHTVKRASNSNIANLYGVVAGEGDVNFVNKSGGTVQVAASGVIDALLSTLNGDIKSGDPVTVSTVEGVGEKSLGRGKIIGIAQGDLNGSTSGARDFALSAGSAKSNVKVAMVPVKIEVGEYNPSTGSVSGSIDDVSDRSKIEQIADSVAGKPVRAITLVTAGVILLLSIFSSIFLVTTSSYASIVSLGRNPMSEHTIVRSLLRLVGISSLIFLTGLGLAYIVLRLFS